MDTTYCCRKPSAGAWGGVVAGMGPTAWDRTLLPDTCRHTARLLGLT